MPRRLVQRHQDVLEDTLMGNDEVQAKESLRASDSGYLSQSDASSKENDSHHVFPQSSLDILGSRAKQLVNAVNELEEAGIEASGLPLPKIVAIGDQSAGKSSLIEAISHIKVPRATGTCTRCPLQINLVNDEHESWKVTVHSKYHYLGPRGIGGKFGSWQPSPQPSDVVHPHISSAKEVESAIKRAQLAVLCPDQDPRVVFQGSISRRSVEFSPNVVKIDIKGPTLPTLTLYDLPGIIAQADNNDHSLPAMIHALAEQHISNPSTIVMLACQIGSDLQNSNAVALVERLQAQDRSIGVITKPDKLSREEADQWLALLDGRGLCKLKHGFFVTKQPSSEELERNITHADARHREDNFFSTNGLWTHQRFARHQARFGTTQLSTTLSKLLAEEIARGLPALNRTIDQQLEVVKSQLRLFPTPEDAPVRVVFEIINQINKRVNEVMIGEFPNNQLTLEWREKANEYRKQLSDMQPVAVMKTGFENQWRTSSSATEPISIDDSDDDREPEESPSWAGSKRSMAPPSTPSKRVRQSTERSERQFSLRPKKNGTVTPPIDLSKATNPPSEYARVFKLDEIRNIIRDRSTSGQPVASDPRAEDALTEESMTNWEVPMMHFLSQMREVVNATCISLVKDILRRWTGTPIATEAVQIIQMYLHGIQDTFQEKCVEYLKAELHKPTTFNEPVLDFWRKKELAHFRDHRKVARQRAYIEGKEALGDIRKIDGNKRHLGVKDTQLLEDPYAAEIEVIARIRGYYCTASGTLVDFVTKSMQYDIFVECRKTLTKDLGDKLGIHEADVLETCTRLVKPDPLREKERVAFEEEKSKLEKARRMLAKIQP